MLFRSLDANDIEWVACGYNIGMNKSAQKWALRHSSEYDWAKERTMLLQEIGNLKRDIYAILNSMTYPSPDNDDELEQIIKKYHQD